jgi:hypothetical protein
MPICVTAKLAKFNSIRLRIVFSRVAPRDLTQNDPLTVISHMTLNDSTEFYVNESWSVLIERAELLSANQITPEHGIKIFFDFGFSRVTQQDTKVAPLLSSHEDPPVAPP